MKNAKLEIAQPGSVIGQILIGPPAIERFVCIHVCRVTAKAGFKFVLASTAVSSFPFARSSNSLPLKEIVLLVFLHRPFTYVPTSSKPTTRICVLRSMSRY
jgi:hypothetical protein